MSQVLNMEVQVVNWRCIKDVELELSRLNVFMGRNSTGKSSLAYAIYFASKSSEQRPLTPDDLLMQLYGYGFDMLARIADDEPQFPISIKIGDQELVVRPKQGEAGKLEVIRPRESPWVDEYLLPSRRIDYLHLLMFMSKLARAATGERARTRPLTGALAGIISMLGGFLEIFKELPIIPPFGRFAMDLTRALGVPIEPISGEIHDVGIYIVSVPYVLQLVDFTFKDPFTKLMLPLELSPDGIVDLSLFDIMTARVPEGSLIVIEEPEIHKNPVMVMDFAEQMARRALERDLTIVMTTHSDLIPSALAGLVGHDFLKPDDLKVYYLSRTAEKPWTEVTELEIYEDGTFEGFPDAEEVVSRLF